MFSDLEFDVIDLRFVADIQVVPLYSFVQVFHLC